MPISPVNEAAGFKDVINFVKNIGTKTQQKRRSDDRAYAALRSSSIAKATQKLVFSFPVICSDAVSPETATMITKAIEKNCTSMLQMLLTSMYLTGYNGADVISRFHTNLGNDMDLIDYIDKAAGLVGDIGDAYNRASSTYHMFVNKESAELRDEFLKSLNKHYPDSSFSEHSINDYFLSSNYRGYTAHLSSLKEVYTNSNDKDFDKDKSRNDLDKIKTNHDLLTKQLLPTDAQKANELQPTLMLIRYAVPNDKSGVADVVQEFVAGVKAHLTPLPSAEIIEQFGKYLNSRVTNLQLVKATTGEINFSKDLMAAVKDAKLDAKKDSLSTTSPIWRMLQARSAASGARRVAHSRNTAAAITTLVITQQEADIIKMDYDLDLLNPANAMKFMQTYNLLCFVIVDDSTDTARFLYDAEKFYTSYSYTALEREVKNGLSERSIVNLIGHAH